MAFEADQVVGFGSAQELLCQTVDLGCHVEEIKEIRKTVIVDSCEVVFDKVIIDGRLRKDIMFKAARAGFPKPGTVAGCAGVTATVTGPIQDVDVEVAFTALVPVPGARPGDRCVVLQAFVEGEKEEPANIHSSGAFSALVDKSIVFLSVKVVRDVVTNDLTGGGVTGGVTVGGAAGGVVAGGAVTASGVTSGAIVLDGAGDRAQVVVQRPSTGFFPGGNGTIPATRPGPFPGTWIGPTLVFPGVLNPGIPTMHPAANKVLTRSPSQIQVTPVQTSGLDGVGAGDIAAGVTFDGGSEGGLVLS